MVKVSVVVPCRKGTNINSLLKALNEQTFQDFETIVIHGESISRNRNSGIEQANGDIIVFTESDCFPTRTWLEELVSGVEEGKIVRGQEVMPAPLSVANVAITRRTLGDVRFNTGFPLGEDTEFLLHLMSKGIAVKELDTAIVFHRKTSDLKKRFTWSFMLGAMWVRIRYRYRGLPLSRQPSIGFHVARIVESVLGLIGAVLGIIVYLPEKKKLSS